MVIVSGDMGRQVAVNDRAFVVVCLMRLICVHVEERPRGRIQLHAEAHEQDEA